MTWRGLVAIVATLAMTPMLASAQKAATTLPAVMGPPGLIGPSTGTPGFGLGTDKSVDLPAGWMMPPNFIAEKAFIPRTDAGILEGIRRPGGSDSSAMPYAFVEHTYPEINLGSVGERQEFAEKIADYYRTAVNPPSRAERPPSWRKATVTKVRHDPTSARFAFEATETYDSPMGEVHVYVVGQYDRERLLIFSVWTDAAYDDAHPGECRALRDSFRLNVPVHDAVAAAGRSVRRFTQVLVGALVLGVIAIQVVVLVRERRARRGDAIEHTF